ncbi:hypothetical protein PHYSODRAFT_491965 [Phytophthora sojae]|uniref:Macro domain-containing protein n=1 Tax=Phytophthora sojae (strain P6497) TaxID=1094619 RepID=G4ZBX4_PHYSP|nr:hypothetical protein PHYSODRAFT_491965 [Phytophthora sojae]EGZ22075.1 hypothetical protein PHYSODRAFT_491965 [Phytophthora sojae]|eukprot:XP_009524792.1 hypothetical protein PHYSODRAFT_491965 [Phytophthora sojae]
MWSGRRRSAKTGRLSSAADTEPPKLRLTGTLLLRKDLLHDFLLYLDADSLLALCTAMGRLPHCQVDLDTLQMHRSVSVLTGGCDALADYLSLRAQLECFARCVHVVKGDLETITSVGDEQVDCLVFPASTTYQDPGRGVAGRVHERAGPNLNLLVTNLALRRTAKAGSVLCTVGCDSGVRLLVHCVGPVHAERDADTLLYKAYVNALLAADNNHVKCAAVASISTGLYRFPSASSCRHRAECCSRPDSTASPLEHQGCICLHRLRRLRELPACSPGDQPSLPYDGARVPALGDGVVDGGASKWPRSLGQATWKTPR